MLYVADWPCSCVEQKQQFMFRSAGEVTWNERNLFASVKRQYSYRLSREACLHALSTHRYYEMSRLHSYRYITRECKIINFS